MLAKPSIRTAAVRVRTGARSGNSAGIISRPAAAAPDPNLLADGRRFCLFKPDIDYRADNPNHCAFSHNITFFLICRRLFGRITL